MIGKSFVDPETDRIYHVIGVVPVHHDIVATEGALIVTQGDFKARLVSSFEADKFEGKLAVRVEVIIRANSHRYPVGTSFALYRVANWKSGKVWATPPSQFHREFTPLDGSLS